MNVGLGDGHTTGFNTPLSLFVENSDTVYVDGVAKIRGADYTINNISAASKKGFVQPINFMYAESNDYAIYKRKPLILTLSDKALIKDINRIRLSCYYWSGNISGTTIHSYVRTSESSGWSQRRLESFGTLIVDVSDDGNNWNNLFSVNMSSFGLTQGEQYYNKVLDDTLNTKYIRFTIDSSTGGTEAQSAYDLRIDLNGFGANTGLFYDTDEPQLVFTEAPAEGATITMDASIDRPFKTNQFVIDAAMTLHFGDV